MADKWKIVERPTLASERLARAPRGHRCKLPSFNLGGRFGELAVIECAKCGQRWVLADRGGMGYTIWQWEAT